jgi:putative photosynthetic complex assembly protein
MHLADRRNILPLTVCGSIILGLVALVGSGMPSMVATRGLEAPVVARDLRFQDSPSGEVVILDWATNDELLRIPVAEGGFVRGTLRALARERRQERQGEEPPFRVSAWADGQLTLDDRATGRRVDLTAFGIQNAKLFAGLLPVPAMLGEQQR